MNRQMKRMLQRQGQLGPDGEPAAAPARQQQRTRQATISQSQRSRTKPREFLHEVNVEMRKVVWPSRAEVANYSAVVFIALAVLITLIFLMDYVSAKGALFLFK
jgi:preprotein translocase subunit SecE